MNLYLDTISPVEAGRWKAGGIVAGITTNWAMMRDLKPQDRGKLVTELLEATDGDLHVQIGDKWPKRMDGLALKEEIRALADRSRRIVVKVPADPWCMKLVSEMRSEVCRFNVTMVATRAQATLAARAGAEWISVYYARGLEASVDVIQRCGPAKGDAKLLVASLRQVDQVEACLANELVDAVTVTPALFAQLFQSGLTDEAIRKMYGG